MSGEIRLFWAFSNINRPWLFFRLVSRSLKRQRPFCSNPCTGWPDKIRPRNWFGINCAVWPSMLFSISIWLGIFAFPPYDSVIHNPHPPQMQRTEFVLRIRRHRTGMEEKKILARASIKPIPILKVLEWQNKVSMNLAWFYSNRCFLCFHPSTAAAATHTWLSGIHT